MHNRSNDFLEVNFLANNTSLLYMFRTISYILIATIATLEQMNVNTETLTTTTLMITFGNDELDDKFSQTTTR